MIGWFEVRSGAGFRHRIELFQIKEIQKDKKPVIQIEHLMGLGSRKKCEGNAIGDRVEIEISQKKIRLFNCNKLTFWLEETQTLANIRLFPSREAYQAALKMSFPNIEWHFDQ